VIRFTVDGQKWKEPGQGVMKEHQTYIATAPLNHSISNHFYPPHLSISFQYLFHFFTFCSNHQQLRLAYSSVAASLALWLYSTQLPLSAAAAGASSLLPVVLGGQMCHGSVEIDGERGAVHFLK